VAAELRRFLDGEPIHARPLSQPARLWRWAKRRPAAATAATLAAIVMVAGPIAALVIDAQRRDLSGRVKELDELVIGQQEANRDLRGKSAGLQKQVEEFRRLGVAEDGAGLDDWRRTLISDVLDRRAPAALAAADAGDIDADSRARIRLGLGMMLAEVNRTAEAVEQLTAARSALEELAAEAPDDLRVQGAVANCSEQLAELYQVQGDDEKSRAAAAMALRVQNRLSESQTDGVADIDLLALNFNISGMRKAEPREVAAKLESLRRLSSKVVDEWPSDAAGVYEAACRHTNKTPLLNLPL
jgi:predicted component of type VI protein secretion system